ncbi:hypothetical protein [Streptomyces sp. bgisy100]|uniref:hypothetical protein n=1 Tax=Streptomyces sp. bgisy100 TaxID=3413783 RepID=UPI003D72B03C
MLRYAFLALGSAGADATEAALVSSVPAAAGSAAPATPGGTPVTPAVAVTTPVDGARI